ncbi:hypothetical protein D3C81_308830 [compost metagenome]
MSGARDDGLGDVGATRRKDFLRRDNLILLSGHKQDRQIAGGQHIPPVGTFPHRKRRAYRTRRRSLIADLPGPLQELRRSERRIRSEQAGDKPVDKFVNAFRLDSRYRLEPLLLRLLAVRVRRGMNQAEGVQAGSVPLGERKRNVTAERVSKQRHLRDIQRIEQGQDIACHLFNGVRAERRIGRAMPAQIGRYHAVAPGQ